MKNYWADKRQRFEILARFDFACAYCGRRPPEVKLHVDHKFPKEAGGNDSDRNLVAACADCNLGKGKRIYAFTGARAPEDFLIVNLPLTHKTASRLLRLVYDTELTIIDWLKFKIDEAYEARFKRPKEST